MANMFEFTQVKAPDLSTSATLLRNAGKSVDDAVSNFTAGADMVREANIERDTRVRQDNTNYWVNRISQAQTPDEVDILRQEIGSDEFRSQYENDLYVDTSKLLTALDDQPKDIKDRAVIENQIQTTSQDPVVAGMQGAISKATTESQVRAVLKDAETRGFTTASMSLLLDTANARISGIQGREQTNIANAASRRQLQQQQITEQLNKDINTRLPALIQSASNRGISQEQLAIELQDLTNELGQKYPTANLANIGTLVNGIGVNQYSTLSTGKEAVILGSMSPDQQSKYITSSTILSMDNEAAYDRDVSLVSQQQYPDLTQAAASPIASKERTRETLKVLRDAKIPPSAFTKLPKKLRTDFVLDNIESMGSASDVDTYISDLVRRYPEYTAFKKNMNQTKTLYMVNSRKERDRLQRELKSTSGDLYKIKTQIDKASSNGEDISELLAKQAAGYKKLDTISGSAVNLQKQSELDLYKLSELTIEAARKQQKTIFKDSMGTEDKRQAAIAQLEAFYGLTPDILKYEDIPKTSVNGVPIDIPKTIVETYRTLLKKQSKATKSTNSGRTSRNTVPNTNGLTYPAYLSR